MKLFFLLLLTTAVIAASVLAPQNDFAATDMVTTKPLEINFPAAMGTSGEPYFFDFKFTMVESCKNGLMYPSGTWSHQLFSAHLDLQGPAAVYVVVNGKAITMKYDFSWHATNYAYGDCKWGSDTNTAKLCGLCVDGAWQGAQLKCGQGETRTRYRENWCYVKVQDSSAQATQESKLNNIAARDLASQSPDAPAIGTVTHALTTPTIAALSAPDGRIAYYGFSLSVTEYCEASEGTPLKARGWWSVKDSSAGQKVDFDDGHMATSFNLGYPDHNLQVGPYDYWTHRVGFHYGGCHWDQDIDGVAKCGFCVSQPWSSGELNCASNVAAGRNHGMDCMVAVQYESASHDLPKPLAPREDKSEDAVALEATATTTLVPEVIATQTADKAYTTILPFHFSVTEFCENGSKKVTGQYSNGNIHQDVTLWPGLIVGIVHGVPNFPPIYIGPFDYNTSRLRYSYASGPIKCEWFDDEAWKQCGECRAGLWSGAPINCAAGGSRTKQMDCSFIMGDK